MAVIRNCPSAEIIKIVLQTLVNDRTVDRGTILHQVVRIVLRRRSTHTNRSDIQFHRDLTWNNYTCRALPMIGSISTTTDEGDDVINRRQPGEPYPHFAMRDENDRSISNLSRNSVDVNT